MIHFVPQPKTCKESKEKFIFGNEIVITSNDFADVRAVKVLKDELKKKLGIEVRLSATAVTHGITLCYGKDADTEAYTLDVKKDGIVMASDGKRGMYYAVVTLLQLVGQYGNVIPCVAIKDAPDIEKRGVWLDLTRGRVATAETLKDFIRRLSFYKVNQVYFYMEHTFAYPGMTEGYRDASPLTPEDVIDLRAFADQYYMELIPGIATFGHLYQILSTKSFNRLRAVAEIPNNEYSWIDRQIHHTLDVANPESTKLSLKMIDEVYPLFDSPYIHIGCDETFDLGHGRSEKFAKGKSMDDLYSGYVKPLFDYAVSRGKKPMIFADLFHRDDMPDPTPYKDAVLCGWGYGPKGTEKQIKNLSRTGCEFFICSGTNGWNRFINHYADGEDNNRAIAEQCVGHPVKGIINTDWGDQGHVNTPELSMPVFGYSAAFHWNAETKMTTEEIEDAVCRNEYGVENFVPLLKSLHDAEKFNWADINSWREQSVGHKVHDGSAITYWVYKDFSDARPMEDMKKAYKTSCDAEQKLYEIMAKAPAEYRERLIPYVLAARGIVLANALFVIIKIREFGAKCKPIVEPAALAEQWELWLDRYEREWRRHYRESELRHIAEQVSFVCDYLRS